MLFKLRVAFATSLFLMAGTVAAQITINVPADQPTIQQGIAAANAGDTVLVAPGTYPENLTINKAIFLKSSACMTVTTGCNAQTIIDGQKQGSVIIVTNVFSLITVINGFTLTNGQSGSSGSSAGVELDNSGAIVANNSFTSNAVALSVNSGAVNFVDNTVSDNIVNGSVCSSANGLYLTGTNTLVLDGTGAVAPAFIYGNTISASGKCSGGVGIIDQQGSNTNIVYNQISNQSLGINVFPNNAVTYITDNLITGNTTGGIYIIHQTDVPSPGPPDTFLLDNTIANNLSAAKGFSGSAGPAELAISGTFSRVEVVNNILYANSKTNPVLDCTGVAPTGSNSITPIVLDHNLLYNAATNGAIATNGCGPLPTLYENLSGAYDLNLELPPSFASSTSYQLASGSPAIDAGNNSSASVVALETDLIENHRVQATLMPMPVVDIGAYETAGSAQIGYMYTSIAATPSTYYLQSGNSITISAQLIYGGFSGFTPISNQAVSFTGIGPNSQIVTPVTVNTDANGNASASFVLANYGMYAFESNYVGPGYQAAHSIPVWVYVANPLAVTTIGLSSSVNPSLVGQNVTFAVTSNATDGTHPSPVVLADNGTTLATLVTSSGSATYATSTLAQGTHPMTATFAGDATHTSGTASLSQLVGNYTTTTTALSSSVNPSVIGQSITLTAHIASASGVPTGSVIFLDGSTQLGAAVTVNSSGNATYTTTTFTLGSHSLTANFTATGTYANSSGTFTQIVNGDPTQSVLTVAPTTATYGTSVTLSAQVSVIAPYTGTPTGTVTFLDGATVIGTSTVTGGIATLTSSTFSVGAHAFSCTYSGSSTLAASTCNVVSTTITQATTSTAVSSSSNPSPAYAPLTFTVKSASGGQPLAAANVTLTITPTGGTATSYSLTTDATGTASYAFTGFPAGTYLVAATYPATANYSASKSSLTQTVTVDATVIKLVATPNPGIQNNPVALGASVVESGGLSAPTGSVTYLDGATPLGTVTLSPTPGSLASAVLTTSALTPGVHTISASYTPSDPSFSASGPTTISLTILPQDFTLTANPPSITIQTEHHGTLGLTLTSIGGFPAPITLNCGQRHVRHGCAPELCFHA